MYKRQTEAEDPDYPSQLFNKKIYLDNFRIVPITAITVSDY